MGAPVPSHQQIELVGLPPATSRPDALTVQRCGEVGIGGHPSRAELVQEETEMCRRRGPGARDGSHGGRDRDAARWAAHTRNMVIAGDNFQNRSLSSGWSRWNAGWLLTLNL